MQRKINQSNFPFLRGRRIRNSSWIRNLTSEEGLNKNDLIQPIFVKEDNDKEELIEKMPGIKRYSISSLAKEIEEIINLGIRAVALFPKIDQKLKTINGDEAINPENLICKTLKFLRSEFPELGVICDVALDPYTISGHDGVLDQNGNIDNDKSLEILSEMSINLANAGCEILAPSDMMDGRIRTIREQLEKNKFPNVCLMSYSAKFCSNFYGPFRNALGNEKNLGLSSKKHIN